MSQLIKQVSKYVQIRGSEELELQSEVTESDLEENRKQKLLRQQSGARILLEFCV